MIIKILVTLFALFAFSRAYLRYRDRLISILVLILWAILWIAITFFVWLPKISDILANNTGIGRGVDALVDISIVVLFYGMFRIYVKLEFIEREITSLVRNLALKNVKKDDEKKTTGRISV